MLVLLKTKGILSMSVDFEQASLLIDLDFALAKEVLKEPAKRWRNRWRKARAPNLTANHIPRAIGEEFWGAHVWPSCDTAESSALECLARNIAQRGFSSVDYLGAFPMEEAP